MEMKEQDYLEHYGILRKSGRYPWGSGSNPNQRSQSFMDTVQGLRDKGMKDAEIAKGFGMSLKELRNARSIASNELRQQKINRAQRLADKGYSPTAIGERMGINESSVRALLAPGAKAKVEVLQTTANMLKDQVADKQYLDIGTQVEKHLGVSRNQLDTAVAMLREQGYVTHTVKIPQAGTNEKTTVLVLAKPGTTQKQIWQNRDQIRQVTEFSDDGGKSFIPIQPPLSISSKRIGVNYREDGGDKADGVIYVRPGVKDVSIGSKHYAQVRIAVDGSHYLKGMAIYKDDLPKGVDLVFNTKKTRTKNKLDAMKPLKDDKTDPFGSVVRQIVERDSKGRPRVVSVMNKVGSKPGQYEEGGWSEWSRTLSSQILSKQKPELAQRQLEMMHDRRRSELEEILSLTNPAVRRRMLESLADEADSASVHLKAAEMRGQANHVILPVPSMKDTEVYAPAYRNGTRVALIRHPHGGTFEIPQLTVNNRNQAARKLLGTSAEDAIGINHRVAQRLSGADFDGDAVLVIPNNRGDIKSTAPLEGLKNFDPQRAYPEYPGMRKISKAHKQQQMGDVSNLITDMTIRGASTQEIARAVRHSMVVIDAEKHNLDWRSSYRDNGIAKLKEEYQGKHRSGQLKGASTLISRASAKVRVPKRKPRPASQGGPVDKKTGKKVFVNTGETFRTSKGKVEVRKTVSKRLAETDDAHSLVSEGGGTKIERVYADHSNRMKAMANEARRHAINTKTVPRSPSAAKVYKKQVESLDAKLHLAQRNAPLERQAQVIADANYRQIKRANPDRDADDLRKLKFQALNEARNRTGAKKHRVEITPDEWKAIQAGAISNHKLKNILDNADLDIVKELATPKTKLLMTSAKKSRAQAMLGAGYTQAEVAAALGVSLTTLKNSLA